MQRAELSVMRRLNHDGYDSTIHDLVGETAHLAGDFPPNEQGLGVSNNADALNA